MFMEEDDLFETSEVKAEGTSNTQIHAHTHACLVLMLVAVVECIRTIWK